MIISVVVVEAKEVRRGREMGESTRGQVVEDKLREIYQRLMEVLLLGQLA